MSTKTKILFLLDFFPFPENRDGLTKIMANTINRLSDSYEITLLTVNANKVDLSCIRKNIVFLETTIPFNSLQKRINQFTFLPMNTLTLKMINQLDSEFDFNQYQIVHTGLHSFVKLSKIHKNVICGLNDSLSITCLNNTLKGKLKYYYFRIVELRLAKMNHVITVVSKNDAKSYYYNKSLVLPIGVNTDEFYPSNTPKIDGFVFHGVLDYQVNIDSIKKISNTLNKLSENYNLHIVGRLNGENKSEVINFYESLPNCKYIGEVDNISIEITKYQFYISLMNSGAGVKNKILEAMSCGMLVLVNERAIEGFSNKNELLESVFLIKNPIDIKDVVNNSTNWEKKSTNAIEFVKKYYSWQKYMSLLENKYKELTKF